MPRPPKLAAILLGLAIAAGAAAVFLLQPAAMTTRIAAYPQLLKDWSATGLVDHFPPALPPKATDVTLFANPPSQQGSGAFQLRMTLPRRDVQAILAATEMAAIRRCPGQCPTDVKDPEFWQVPALAAGRKSEIAFPSEYVVYALATNGDPNRPQGKGVAISLGRGEVVYWAED